MSEGEAFFFEGRFARQFSATCSSIVGPSMNEGVRRGVKSLLGHAAARRLPNRSANSTHALIVLPTRDVSRRLFNMYVILYEKLHFLCDIVTDSAIFQSFYNEVGVLPLFFVQ